MSGKSLSKHAELRRLFRQLIVTFWWQRLIYMMWGMRLPWW